MTRVPQKNIFGNLFNSSHFFFEGSGTSFVVTLLKVAQKKIIIAKINRFKHNRKTFVQY